MVATSTSTTTSTTSTSTATSTPLPLPPRLRMSPLEFDFSDDDDDDDDEELPGYEACTAPAYSIDAYDEPLSVYCLRQYDRKIQVLGASSGTSGAGGASYRFTTNSFRLFSSMKRKTKRKPELEVLYTSAEMRQRVVATIGFQDNGPLPWRPRAVFSHTAMDGSAMRCEMESRNFADWTFGVAGVVYVWKLCMRPVVSHVLCEVASSSGSSVVIARFRYSERGALAGNGEEVGELVVYRDCLTMNQVGVDSLVCGLMVAMTYMRKMGKFYRNDVSELERANSLTRELSLTSMV